MGRKSVQFLKRVLIIWVVRQTNFRKRAPKNYFQIPMDPPKEITNICNVSFIVADVEWLLNIYV